MLAQEHIYIPFKLSFVWERCVCVSIQIRCFIRIISLMHAVLIEFIDERGKMLAFVILLKQQSTYVYVPGSFVFRSSFCSLRKKSIPFDLNYFKWSKKIKYKFETDLPATLDGLMFNNKSNCNYWIGFDSLCCEVLSKVLHTHTHAKNQFRWCAFAYSLI